MSADTGRVTISRFSSDTDEQKQVLPETVVFCMLQTRWLAVIDIPFSLSKTKCSNSATSCWVLKLLGIKDWMGQQFWFNLFFQPC